MEISKVLTFDINRIPQEGSQTFRADASYVWSQISPVIDSMNVVIGEINISTEEAHKYRDESLNYSSESKNARFFTILFIHFFRNYFMYFKILALHYRLLSKQSSHINMLLHFFPQSLHIFIFFLLSENQLQIHHQNKMIRSQS